MTHDTGAYTQGLIYSDGFLYESTGLNGRSTLRKMKLETGEYRLGPEAVLNGIAYDATRDRFFVTGKLWPKLFEIKLERRKGA